MFNQYTIMAERHDIPCEYLCLHTFMVDLSVFASKLVWRLSVFANKQYITIAFSRPMSGFAEKRTWV
jgi:hypothetical protein